MSTHNLDICELSTDIEMEQINIFSIIENQLSQGKITQVETKKDEMQIPTIKEMKSALVEKLLTSLGAWKMYISSKNQLETLRLGEGFPYIYIRDIVGVVVKSHFEKMCVTLTKNHSDDTPAEITLDESYFDFKSRDSWNINNPNIDERKRANINKQLAVDTSKTEEEIEELIVEVIESIPFEAITYSLRSQVKNIGTLGLQLIAGTLVSELNLSSSHRKPRNTARHFICQTASKGKNESGDVLRLAKALEKVEKDTAILFGDGLYLLAEAVRESGGCIESRTHFSKGQALEVYCFKDKYEFRFTKKAFEAISAFIYCYGSDRDINSLDEVLNNQQAA